MKVIQVGPGGMNISIGMNAKPTMSGNATVTEMSTQDFLNFLQAASGGPSEEDELDDNEETECLEDEDPEVVEEIEPPIVYPEHLSSRWILSVPRREDETVEDHLLRTDRISTFVQEGLEKEFPTLSASVSFTLGTIMGSTTIPQQVVTAEVTGFNAFDEFDQQMAISNIVHFGTELFGRFN